MTYNLNIKTNDLYLGDLMEIAKILLIAIAFFEVSAFAQSTEFTDLAYKQLRDSYSLTYKLNLLPGKDYKIICPENFKVERSESKTIFFDSFSCDSQHVLINVVKQAFNNKIERLIIWSKESLDVKNSYSLNALSGKKIVNIDWFVENGFLPSSKIKLSWLNGRLAKFQLLRMLNWAGLSSEISRDYKKIKLASSNGGESHSLDLMNRVVIMLTSIFKGCSLNDVSRQIYVRSFLEQLLLKIGNVSSDDDKEVVSFIKNEKLILKAIEEKIASSKGVNVGLCHVEPDTLARLSISTL